MERSSAALTTSVVQTPSPTHRRETTSMYPDLNSAVTPDRTLSTTRNVRFTDNTTPSSSFSRLVNPYGTSFASAPPSRVQSGMSSQLATGPTPPRARLPVAGSSSSLQTASPSSSATQSHPTQQRPTFSLSSLPISQKLAAPLSSVAATPKVVADKLAPEVSRRQAPPLGRGEAAKRLRVNAILLVMWWLSSRTHVYKFAAGHLVQFVPQLDTPLHLLESVFALVLVYNILDSMRHLNRLSSLPLPSAVNALVGDAASPATNSPRLRQSASQPQLVHSPVRSSPKTRPTAPTSAATPGSGSPSTPVFRASARNSPQPPSPQTPSLTRSTSAGSALRQSTLPTTGSPLGGSPLSRSTALDESLSMDKGSPLRAFRARHSPVASRMTVHVDSKEGIDKIFG